ncbi:MAG: DNA integrity scanning protein DisA nucleotide-binding domain protein [bacterium]|nr:DNA integrity scanning protein DisA nucleotide-binding domain protein [bacterium]
MIQMFVGLGLLLVLSFPAQLLGMMVVGRIIGTLETVWVVAFIIIFQPELRAALATLGLGRGLFGRVREIPAEQELLKAVARLSKRGLGAIIVIEREVRLSDWIQKGVPLDAEITAATIEAIFTVPGPLHDGAVIISGSKIAAAAVILPITEREELGYVLGTRHLAAIGISEQSDAIVLVVSRGDARSASSSAGISAAGCRWTISCTNWSASTAARPARAFAIAGRATAPPRPRPRPSRPA